MRGEPSSTGPGKSSVKDVSEKEPSVESKAVEKQKGVRPWAGACWPSQLGGWRPENELFPCNGEGRSQVAKGKKGVNEEELTAVEINTLCKKFGSEWSREWRSKVRQSMSESIQLHRTLYVLMYMCNKSKGWGGLLSEDFMPHILLKYYHNSVQNGMFLVPSSHQHQETACSWVYTFMSLIMELSLFVSHPFLIFYCLNEVKCVQMLKIWDGNDF